MPVYRFTCADCDAVTDRLASISELEAGLTVACEACASTDTRRMLSTFSTPGRASASALAATSAGQAATGDGCCGGGCCGP